MKQIVGYPPNINDIKQFLNPADHAIYCYGDTIYNPSGRELTADQQHHESIHTKQQGINPDGWWTRYLTEPAFRLSQEIQAYGEQYIFVLNLDIPAKFKRWVLENMAKALASESYGHMLSYGEAVSKIRNYGSS